MCSHVFKYPEDKRENYNPDGKTLTGICKLCGVKQQAYGIRWMIPRYDNFLAQNAFGEISRFNFIDKNEILW